MGGSKRPRFAACHPPLIDGEGVGGGGGGDVPSYPDVLFGGSGASPCTAAQWPNGQSPRRVAVAQAGSQKRAEGRLPQRMDVINIQFRFQNQNQRNWRKYIGTRPACQCRGPANLYAHTAYTTGVCT